MNALFGFICSSSRDSVNVWIGQAPGNNSAASQISVVTCRCKKLPGKCKSFSFRNEMKGVVSVALCFKVNLFSKIMNMVVNTIFFCCCC